jgi:hypothetical protein
MQERGMHEGHGGGIRRQANLFGSKPQVLIPCLFPVFRVQRS